MDKQELQRILNITTSYGTSAAWVVHGKRKQVIWKMYFLFIWKYYTVNSVEVDVLKTKI